MASLLQVERLESERWMAVSNFEVERGRTEAAQQRLQQLERDDRSDRQQLESTIDALRAQLSANREAEVLGGLEESTHAMHLRDTIRQLEHENAILDEAVRSKARHVGDLEEQLSAERRVIADLKKSAAKVGAAARQLQEDHAQVKGELRALREWQQIATEEMKAFLLHSTAPGPALAHAACVPFCCHGRP